MERFKVEKPGVKHHEQDVFDSCGPACAQMIIAHLAHKHAAPVNPRTAPIIDQSSLRVLASATHPAWATRPDDFVKMLNDPSNMLDPGWHFWRVVEVDPDQQHELVAEIAVAIQQSQTPAAIVTTRADHWCVVTRIDMSSSGPVLHLDNPDVVVAPGTTSHFYVDDCQNREVIVGDEVVKKVVRLDRRPFGGLDLTVQPVPHDGTDASGYDGKAIAIIYGNPRDDYPREFERILAVIAPTIEVDRGDELPLDDVLPRGEGQWLRRLSALIEETADQAEIDVIKQMELVKPPRLVHRLTEDDQPGDAFVLVAAFSGAAQVGVIAAFDVRSLGRPLAFRLVRSDDGEDVKLLQKRVDEALFWTPTKHTRYPTEPFTIRTVDGIILAKRLSDDFEFELPGQ